MRTRIGLVVGIWTAIVVGAFGLFGGAAAPLGIAAGTVGLAALGVGRARAARHGRARMIAASVLPSGSRRVPLAETGIVWPD